MAKYKDSLYPDKINDFIDNEGELSEEAKELVKEAAGGEGNPIKAENGKLIIDEVVQPVGPVPVATIDGVDYYHKQEFDCTQLPYLQEPTCYNILTGEVEAPSASKSFVYSMNAGVTNAFILVTSQGSTAVGVLVWSYTYAEGGDSLSPDLLPFISGALRVVSTVEEVTDNTSICLPGVTAFYGKIEGDIFTSYYNLEEEPSIDPIPVTKIKDVNNNEVEINDSRLVVTSADVGKVVGVNDNGELALLPAPSGGTKLYLHSISANDNEQYNYQNLMITTNPNPYTTNDFIFDTLGAVISFQKHILSPANDGWGDGNWLTCYGYGYETINDKYRLNYFQKRLQNGTISTTTRRFITIVSDNVSEL